MDTRVISYVIIALIIGVALGYGASKLAAPAPMQPQQTGSAMGAGEEEYTIKLAYSPEYGLYLVDKDGRTLYFFAKDVDGKSHCYGECAQKWPVFYVENINPGPGLDKNDFGVITRDDGTKQITYKGWPLYYFFQDKNPGDINGEGKKGVWFVAKPDYSVMIGVKEGLGAYLVTPDGRTLYFFANDKPGNSTCYGMCAEKWPPYAPKPLSLVIPSTLNITDFSFIKRNDGTIQLAYKGHPLYLWINDKTRGDTTGHGVKGVWFVASITGQIP
ncbi:MAG: hypothetical protein F7C34_02475 [Desulfurococcales archaeon]|nr:hypothetical protein [Desulfurococcales archaeon]